MIKLSGNRENYLYINGIFISWIFNSFQIFDDYIHIIFILYLIMKILSSISLYIFFFKFLLFTMHLLWQLHLAIISIWIEIYIKKDHFWSDNSTVRIYLTCPWPRFCILIGSAFSQFVQLVIRPCKLWRFIDFNLAMWNL